MNKRRKFLLASAVMTLAMLSIQWVPVDYRYVAILGLFLLGYLISAWALLDDLKGVEWITVLVPPTFYSTAMALFNFLLPEAFISRLLVVVVYAVGLYAMYLTMNIYSIAAIRTIQLLRAANAVGFLLTIFTLIQLFNWVFSLQQPYWANFLLVMGLSWPIFFSSYWSVKLERNVSFESFSMSAITALILAQAAVMLSFLPVTVWIGSLFISTMAYVSLGMVQHGLSDRLFIRTVYEYAGVGLFVLLATLAITPWR